MWIKQVTKRNSPQGKTYYQYQLSETYRLDGIVKHRSVVYLGDNQLLRDKNTRQLVGRLLENKIKNAPELSEDFSGCPQEVLRLVEEYYSKYLLKISIEDNPELSLESADKREYIPVDPSSTTVFDSKEIGAEWMCHKMLEHIGLASYLEKLGWDKQTIELALVSIISRAVASLSENRTEQWIEQNSAVSELFESLPEKITRHYLYKSASKLYSIKEDIEKFFYSRLTSMFDIDDKIVIYDLTNTYFEGRKDNSKIAKFGRSKEKRYDCKQVVVNSYGLLKHSRIYKCN